ncbi:MAG: M20/M25/M40 family metallo-hydrolase [Pseudomonadota bacterium]
MTLVHRLAFAIGMLLAAAGARAADPAPEVQLFREIYRELVEINTTESVGDTLKSAEAMAARLRAAGFPAGDIQVLSSGPRKGNMVARLRGTGARKPLLLIAHMDVVEAKREDWDFDPFTLQEVDGYFRGRGTIDDKAMASIFVSLLIQYVSEGFKPDRDIIVALTTDEELSDSPHDGAKWLLQHHRDLIDAALAINEGGGGALKGRQAGARLDPARREGLSNLSPRGEGSRRPQLGAAPRECDLPAGRRAAAPGRFRVSDPAQPGDPGLFRARRGTEDPAVATAIRALLTGSTDAQALAPLIQRPGYNAQIRTTCVATMLEAGHAENALPQTARATVNCRILPDEAVPDIERALVRALDDPKIAVIRSAARC